MTGFEPGSSGIGCNCSANCATTTALCLGIFDLYQKLSIAFALPVTHAKE